MPIEEILSECIGQLSLIRVSFHSTSSPDHLPLQTTGKRPIISVTTRSREPNETLNLTVNTWCITAFTAGTVANLDLTASPG